MHRPDGQQGRKWPGHRRPGRCLSSTQQGNRTHSKCRKPSFADDTNLKKKQFLSLVKGKVIQGAVLGEHYVGVPTSPAGPWPSVCPITAVSRGLKPTLSRGIPKARSFAS